MRHWHRLPREPWQCPRPGWMRLGAIWSGGRRPNLWQEVGTRWSLRSFPPQTIRWFHDRVLGACLSLFDLEQMQQLEQGKKFLSPLCLLALFMKLWNSAGEREKRSRMFLWCVKEKNNSFRTISLKTNVRPNTLHSNWFFALPKREAR